MISRLVIVFGVFRWADERTTSDRLTEDDIPNPDGQNGIGNGFAVRVTFVGLHPLEVGQVGFPVPMELHPLGRLGARGQAGCCPLSGFHIGGCQDLRDFYIRNPSLQIGD